MIQKNISGGQTGADRAALDWAIGLGILHGGSCPKGRRAEDGVIPQQYQLQELSTVSYPKRTEKNVVDSDGTVILTIAKTLKGGSKKTAEFAKRHGKPWLHVSSVDPEASMKLGRFIEQHQIKVLKVASPRASSEEGIAGFVRSALDATITV